MLQHCYFRIFCRVCQIANGNTLAFPVLFQRVKSILDKTDARQQSPLGRVALPEEVAYTILFLASAGAEFLTGGILLYVED